TVFSITPGGTEKVLHSFGNKSDGRYPDTPLIEVKGTLYGTTAYGGAYTCGYSSPEAISCGTVFRITPGGAEKVLHSFRPGRHAHIPRGGLIDAGGTLYGTTSRGGVHHNDGTVFSITLSGRVKVLHNFNGTDGQSPTAGLIEVKGTFYGTTSQGGTHDDGTVFSITPGGTEKVLHSFGNKSDGRYPDTPLIEAKSTLYGTTMEGGTKDDCLSSATDNLCGTVFSITPSGTEIVLHSFSPYGGDGAHPDGLIDVKGTLYGTTLNGGAYGYGTVFALTP
ncbi:MAG: choice-of-anchor tandem repeat GloVer-containing protein, partial [Candidatus Cybelea sp.]